MFPFVSLWSKSLISLMMTGIALGFPRALLGKSAAFSGRCKIRGRLHALGGFDAISGLPPPLARRYVHVPAMAKRHFAALQLSKIPDELRDEIYAAEANTPAAKDRKVRIAAYGAVALAGLVLGTANVALTTIGQEGGYDLIEEGYGWTQYIPLLSTKWGGYVDLFAAGIFGTLAELEFKTRDETAERIWEEMQKRRKKSENRAARKATKRASGPLVSTSKGGKRRGTKQKKRLAALGEVIEDEPAAIPLVEAKTEPPMEAADASAGKTGSAVQENGGGIVGTVKRFFNEADDMAAAQALILNKKLEEKGLLEKITDESGLKVIGKEAASKLEKEDKKNEGGSAS